MVVGCDWLHRNNAGLRLLRIEVDRGSIEVLLSLLARRRDQNNQQSAVMVGSGSSTFYHILFC